MKTMLPFLLMTACGVVYTFGDIVMKKWVTNPSFSLYLIGTLLYMTGMNFLAFSYKYRNIAAATSICVILNIILLTFVSWLYFKEPLTAKQLVGIVLSISAVILLES